MVKFATILCVKYKAICFDVDGTLYPIPVMHRLSANASKFHPLFALRYRDMRIIFRKIQDDFSKYGLEDADMTSRECTCLCMAYKRKISTKKAERLLKNRYYIPLERSYRNLPFQAQTVKTLKSVKTHGLSVGVMSDWPLFDKLERIGVSEFVDFRISSTDIGFLKPSKICFERLAAGLGIKTSEMLYVGDSYKKDVLGAVNAGADAVLVNYAGSSKDLFPKALHIFEKWEEFDNWINSEMEAE